MEDALLLARVQFGLNIAFHILFPTITIGLAWLLVVFRIRYERTRDPAWLGTYKLWVKVFALSFAMGVVSGIVMSFQFGTNWPGFMNKVDTFPLAIAYTIQGFAVLRFLAIAYEVRPAVQVASLILTGLAPILVLPLVLGIGFFDAWFDFRRRAVQGLFGSSGGQGGGA